MINTTIFTILYPSACIIDSPDHFKKDTLNISVKESPRHKSPPLPSPAEKMLLGIKTFGSHWLTPYGKATITKEGKTIKISGTQTSEDEQVSISGTIHIIDDRHFQLKGMISLHSPSYGEYKILPGTFLFRRMGKRKYWRLKQPDKTTGFFDTRYHYIDIFMH